LCLCSFVFLSYVYMKVYYSTGLPFWCHYSLLYNINLINVLFILSSYLLSFLWWIQQSFMLSFDNSLKIRINLIIITQNYHTNKNRMLWNVFGFLFWTIGCTNFILRWNILAISNFIFNLLFQNGSIHLDIWKNNKF